LYACVVPKLKGLTLRAAKSALKARSCSLGTVTRVSSTVRRNHVVSQSRKPGTRPPVGTKVSVKVAK
jgi:beta-lactam-binding protein with PASTA domain